MKKGKMYNLQDAAAILSKSMYKSVLKQVKRKAKAIADDINDPNYVAEVDPNELPPKKDKVVYKGCSNKSKKSLKKSKYSIEERKEGRNKGKHYVYRKDNRGNVQDTMHHFDTKEKAQDFINNQKGVKKLKKFLKKRVEKDEPIVGLAKKN